MKKIFLAAVLFASLSMNAKEWKVTTTCGVVGTINLAENATVSQLTAAIATFNFMNCGTYPKTVTITAST